MKQIILGCIGLFFTGSAVAQNSFLNYLERPVPGQGTVKVYQDPTIAALVNGTVPVKSSPSTPANTVSGVSPTKKSDNGESQRNEADSIDKNTNRPKIKAQGYRIQVYAGGNSRNAKQEAQRMASLVRSSFFDLTVYTHFYSPRWICRAGDFKTYEEANEILRQMRATGKFSEAVIVKSVIQIAY